MLNLFWQWLNSKLLNLTTSDPQLTKQDDSAKHRLPKGKSATFELCLSEGVFFRAKACVGHALGSVDMVRNC